MPSKSKKQHNFMEAVAHNPAFAKKTGVPQSVGKEFSKADKGKTFKRGGDMATKKMAAFEKSGKDIEKKGMKEGSKADMAMDKKQMMMKKGGATKKMAMGGMSAPMPAGAPMDPRKAAMIAQMMKARRGGARPGMPPAAPMAPATPMAPASDGMKKGGMPMVMKDGKKVPAFAADGKGKMASGGMAKKMNMGGMAYARGGGIESKGKTKGKMISMKSGGGTKKYC
jgi:hypothetical protein